MNDKADKSTKSELDDLVSSSSCKDECNNSNVSWVTKLKLVRIIKWKNIYKISFLDLSSYSWERERDKTTVVFLLLIVPYSFNKFYQPKMIYVNQISLLQGLIDYEQVLLEIIIRFKSILFYFVMHFKNICYLLS